MHRRLTLDRVLRVDATANLVGGTALVVAGGQLAPAVGLASSWPLQLLGLALVAYGLENALVARRPSVARTNALVTVDVAFGVVCVALAIADPTGAETWVRWALVVLADLSVLMGIAKHVTGDHVRRGRTVAART